MVITDVKDNDRSCEVVCVTTRLRFRGLCALVKFLLAYRHVRQDLHGALGLMHVSLVWERPSTVYILSIWRSEELMRRWVGTEAHVSAVRQTYRNLTHETWSGLWRLNAVSPSARRWPSAPTMEATPPVCAPGVPDWPSPGRSSRTCDLITNILATMWRV